MIKDIPFVKAISVSLPKDYMMNLNQTVAAEGGSKHAAFRYIGKLLFSTGLQNLEADELFINRTGWSSLYPANQDVVEMVVMSHFGRCILHDVVSLA